MESRPDGKVKKEDEKKEIRERTSSSYHFKTFFRLLLLEVSPIFFFHSLSILTWTKGEKGGKKQRRVIGSGDTRDAYNLDGATGIPPPPLSLSPFLLFKPKRKKEPRALSTRTCTRDDGHFFGENFSNCHHFSFFFF